MCSGCRWIGRFPWRASAPSSPAPRVRPVRRWETRSRLLPGPGGTGPVDGEHGRPVEKSQPRTVRRSGSRDRERRWRGDRGRGRRRASVGDDRDARCRAGAAGAAAAGAADPGPGAPRHGGDDRAGSASGADRAGRAGLARLVWKRRRWRAGGDRFVLRSFSPVATIGGGSCWIQRPRGGARLAGGAGGAEAGRPPAGAGAATAAGTRCGSAPVLLGLPGHAAAIARSERRMRQVGNVWIAEARCRRPAAARWISCADYHRPHPADHGMPLETLRRALRATEPVVAAVLDDLVRGRRMRRLEGGRRMAGFAPRAAGGDAAVERIVGPGGGRADSAERRRAGAADRPAGRGGDPSARRRRWAGRGGRAGALLRPRGPRPVRCWRLGRAAAAASCRRSCALGWGSSRKYLIPLLEWADSKGVTVGTARSDGSGSPIRLDTPSGSAIFRSTALPSPFTRRRCPPFHIIV